MLTRYITGHVYMVDIHTVPEHRLPLARYADDSNGNTTKYCKG